MSRKSLTISVVFTFLLFALTLMAQSDSSQTSNPSSGTTSSQNPNSPAGDAMSMPSTSDSSSSTQTGSSTSSTSDQTSSQSGSSMGQSNQSGSSSQMSSSGKAKTIEGCVVREESDYFLVPKRGTPVRISSTGAGDISGHVGHQVKAHGTESMASSMGAGTSGQAGTSGTVAGGETSGTSAQAGQETSGAVGTPTTPPSGTAGAAGTTGTAGSGTGALHSAANREIVVDRVDMVSETCPSNWNPTYNPNATGGKKSKSDQSNY